MKFWQKYKSIKHFGYPATQPLQVNKVEIHVQSKNTRSAAVYVQWHQKLRAAEAVINQFRKGLQWYSATFLRFKALVEYVKDQYVVVCLID